MRKILGAIMAICFAVTANAQKNSILLYGNVNIANFHTKDSTGQSDKRTYLVFSPAIGYQFTEHLTAGVMLNIGTDRRDNTTVDIVNGPVKTKQRSLGYGAGVFFRYTQPISDLFFFYGQFEGSYNTATTKYNDTTVKGLKGYGLQAALMPALGLNVKKGLAVTLNIGGLSYMYNLITATGSSQGAMVFNLGQAINLGISKNFALKAHKINVPQ